MDVLLYNQATIMKMVQDIRLMQSRGLGKRTVGSDDQVEMDVDTPTTSIEFAKEVKEMMADEEIKPLLINLLGKWMANDKAKNKYWDRESDQWDFEDVDEVVYHRMTQLLKKIEGSAMAIQELHIWLGKAQADKGAPKGTKRKRSTGATGAQEAESLVTTAGTSSGTRRRTIEPLSVGDAALDMPDEYDYDDLYNLEEEIRMFSRLTMRMVKPRKAIQEFFRSGELKDEEDVKAAIQESKEDAALRRVYSLMVD
ncbi:hypothetical protein LTR05_001284 [Lithohypha guttulata]|uniref:Uncharacterized protein n=1 Tax=Lithohypha guttulata TaxID=1690604 RepID=A0AAN7T5X8_9EURO|nr:hypothetical protein LTR05_001284 [Lithohypha guttulata]